MDALRIELGGGTRAREGYVNVDCLPCADIQWDLDKRPLPFDDNSCEAVYSSHCLEHLSDPHGLLRDEVCRICRLGARVEIRVPHPLSDGAMTWGHRSVFGEMHVINADTHFVDSFWRPPKRLKWQSTTYAPCEPWFSEARPLFPQLDDQQLMRFIPRTCHECRFVFTVIEHHAAH